MREKKYISLIFTEEADQEFLTEAWRKTKDDIEQKYAAAILYLKTRTTAASEKYKETKSQEDWNNFTAWRGELAGKTSGRRRHLEQQKKLLFVDHIITINKLPMSYTFIQFVAKFIDGRGFDKTTALDLRSKYKDDKANYEILPEHMPMWKAMQVGFYKFTLQKNPDAKKVNKI